MLSWLNHSLLILVLWLQLSLLCCKTYVTNENLFAFLSIKLCQADLNLHYENFIKRSFFGQKWAFIETIIIILIVIFSSLLGNDFVKTATSPVFSDKVGYTDSRSWSLIFACNRTLLRLRFLNILFCFEKVLSQILCIEVLCHLHCLIRFLINPKIVSKLLVQIENSIPIMIRLDVSFMKSFILNLLLLKVSELEHVILLWLVTFYKHAASRQLIQYVLELRRLLICFNFWIVVPLTTANPYNRQIYARYDA